MRILFSFLVLFSGLTFAQGKGKVAIVIDDIGYRSTDVSALRLPSQVAFSVLPHTPLGRELAEKGNQQQREILLHVPMESTRKLTLGPGALTSNMDENSVKNSLQASINDIPHVIGINNHMGSRLTQMSEPMSWTMDFLKKNNLFFLDSRTSKYSQAEFIAQRTGVPTLRRHVFLDNNLNEDYIELQFEKLIDASKRHGSVIAIGHPHPQTITVLQKMLPTLAKHNIELVPVSQMLPRYRSYAQKETHEKEYNSAPK